MAISFNQGGGNVFNFGNNNSQVSIDNKKKLLNAGAQDINQGMAMNPQPGDSVVFNQGNNNNASFQGFNNGMANIGLQMINQAMVMNAPPAFNVCFPEQPTCPTTEPPPPTTQPPPPTTQPPPPTTQPPPPTTQPPPPTTQPPPPTTQPPPPTTQPPPPDVCIVPCVDPETGEFHYYLPVDNSSEFGFLPDDTNGLSQTNSGYTDPTKGYYFHKGDYDYDTKSVPEGKRLTYEQYKTQVSQYQDGDTDIGWSS